MKYQIRRVLCPLVKTIRETDLCRTLQGMGYEAETCEIPCEPASDDLADIEKLSREIRAYRADAVITHDFMIFAAIACAMNGIPYLAWIWDAPDIPLYHDAAQLPTSFLFDFDRLQAAESTARGCPHVIHFPLGAETARIGALTISAEDELRFSCEVSFIGALYSEEKYTLTPEAPQSLRQEVDAVIADMRGRWDGMDRMSGRLSDETIREIGKHLAARGHHPTEGASPEIERRSLEMRILSRRASYLERTEMLQRLSNYDLQFYTTTADREVPIPGVTARPTLHYYNEVPKAYALSKVNLNLTLHSIRSGVPLRCYDIMASGGFLLTNYQPELEDQFVIGEELAVFRDLGEMEEKVDYYLHHEEERQRIAMNGYLKVTEQYSYEKRMAEMIAIVSAEDRWEGKLELA